MPFNFTLLNSNNCEPAGGARHATLTEVTAPDGAVVEGDAEVVAGLSQFAHGHAVRAAQRPRLVEILTHIHQHYALGSRLSVKRKQRDRCDGDSPARPRRRRH